jgi:hypothetical protein
MLCPRSVGGFQCCCSLQTPNRSEYDVTCSFEYYFILVASLSRDIIQGGSVAVYEDSCRPQTPCGLMGCD